VIEIAITLVVPVELHVMAREPAVRWPGLAIRVGDEQPESEHMRDCELANGRDELRAHFCRVESANQQAPPLAGVNGTPSKLWVVGEAVLCVGLRPEKSKTNSPKNAPSHRPARRRRALSSYSVIGAGSQPVPAPTQPVLSSDDRNMAQERRTAGVERVPGGGINGRDAGRGICPHRAQPCIRIRRK
jgi:hypothetical protein